MHLDLQTLRTERELARYGEEADLRLPDMCHNSSQSMEEQHIRLHSPSPMLCRCFHMHARKLKPM